MFMIDEKQPDNRIIRNGVKHVIEQGFTIIPCVFLNILCTMYPRCSYKTIICKPIPVEEDEIRLILFCIVITYLWKASGLLNISSESII